MRPEAGEQWLVELRGRFVEIARKRVPAEAVEDLVQEALVIIHEKRGVASKGTKGSRAPQGAAVPPLPWCFQVLRNVIGNHYQRQRTRDRAATAGSSLLLRLEEITESGREPTPLEALERSELSSLLRSAIAELGSTDRLCGDLLGRMLDPREGEDVRAKARADAAAAASSTKGRAKKTMYASNDGARANETQDVTTSTRHVRAFRCRRKLREILLRRGVRA